MVVVYAYLKSHTPHIVLGWGTAEMIHASGRAVLIDCARVIPASELNSSGEWCPRKTADQDARASSSTRRPKRSKWYPT